MSGRVLKYIVACKEILQKLISGRKLFFKLVLFLEFCK